MLIIEYYEILYAHKISLMTELRNFKTYSKARVIKKMILVKE